MDMLMIVVMLMLAAILRVALRQIMMMKMKKDINVYFVIIVQIEEMY